jgi:biotin-dependent carboxylase-like uncharacterized protein
MTTAGGPGGPGAGAGAVRRLPEGHRDELHVVRGGMLTTVQDGGRPGFAHLAVPRSGWLDPVAAERANRLVGNPPNTPVLETTIDGVALRPARSCMVAVTGAPAAIRVDGRPASWSLPLAVRAGQVLDVGRATAGLRCYVAISGGLAVPRIFGSASTDLMSGLGPPPVRTGDVLPLGAARHDAPAVDLAPYPLPSEHLDLLLYLGPRDDWLSERGRHSLASDTYEVTSLSNRTSLRLSGPSVEQCRFDELPSEGIVWGSVELLPDGQLLVFLAEHPTTGGYPVVGVVDHVHAGACAQAKPGSTVRFRVVTPDWTAALARPGG